MENKDFNITEEMEQACNATLDDFVQKVKETAGYVLFKQAIKKRPDESHTKLLEAISLMESLTDKNFSLMMTSVAHDVLFCLVGQKLKNEILGGAEDGNAD